MKVHIPDLSQTNSWTWQTHWTWTLHKPHMCSLHQVLACSCNGVCDSGPDYNSIPRSKTALQNTFSSKLMCYKLRSHTATQSLGIMSEIMLSPLPALINHQTPPGLCMSFVQCKDPKDYLQQTNMQLFLWSYRFFAFLRKRVTFFTHLFGLCHNLISPIKAELLCQPGYQILMGTPETEGESKINSKAAQHERKHPALYHPWKCIS